MKNIEIEHRARFNEALSKLKLTVVDFTLQSVMSNLLGSRLTN